MYYLEKRYKKIFFFALQVISIDVRTNLLEGTGVRIREGGTAHERPGNALTTTRLIGTACKQNNCVHWAIYEWVGLYRNLCINFIL